METIMKFPLHNIVIRCMEPILSFCNEHWSINIVTNK